MTVSSENRKAGPFSGNNIAATFPFAFRVFSATDIRVVRRGIDGAETDLVLDESYAVTLNEDQNATPGGDVLFVAPPATGETIVITSRIPRTQEAEILNGGGFYPSVVTDALDRVVVAQQEMQEELSRSVRVPITSSDDPAGLAAAIVTMAAYAEDIPALAEDAQTALTSAATATAQATIATTKAGEASDSAAEALADSLLAQSAKADAETAQGIATAQATIATTKAGEAAGSAAAASQSATQAELAKDASLIQAGVYVDTAAGLAAVSVGQYFKVAGSGDVAATEYRKAVSPNLFDTATVRADRLVNSSTGVINTQAGWGCSAFIPVTAGQQYTISGTRGRFGLAFFSSASDSAVVAGSYDGTTTLPLTVTAPVGANFLVINLYSSTAPTYTNVQVEPGAVVTTYSPYGTTSAVLAAAYPSVAALTGAAARLTALEDDVASKDTHVFVTITAKNLYNPANKLEGKYVQSGDGIIVDDAAWATSGFIPVTPGKSYTISAAGAKRSGLAFYATNTSTAGTSPIAGSFVGTGTLPLTVTAPAGANYLLVNIKSNTVPEPADIQIEEGTSATAYEAWVAPYPAVSKDAVYPLITEIQNPSAYSTLSLDTVTPSNNYVEASVDGMTIRHEFAPFTAVTHGTSSVFNFLKSTADGVTFHTTSDDAAPYRVFGTTLGSSHGYAQTHCTMAGHGKTNVDVGSVYRDASLNEWVIAEIVSASVVAITARGSNNAYAGGTLTHYSGGTNTGNIVTTSVSQLQWYPAHKNRSVGFLVDGLPVAAETGVFKYRDSVVINERYDLMNKSSIVEWLITQVGTASAITAFDGTADISVSMSYHFDRLGNCTIYTDFLALNAVASFLDIMFVMSSSLRSDMGFGAIKCYVPKSLPFTHESVAYDFTTPVDMTAWAPATRADFTPARCEPAGILCDRVIQLNDTIGMALGFLPVQDAEVATRRSRAVRKALQIAESKKIYMSCVDTASKTSLAAGDYYSAIAYRAYFVRTSARTSQYAVRSNVGTYLYLDWHVAGVDRVDLPADLQGRAYTVVEKSANVTVLSQTLTNSIVVNVAGTASYGYLILKVT